MNKDLLILIPLDSDRYETFATLNYLHNKNGIKIGSAFPFADLYAKTRNKDFYATLFTLLPDLDFESIDVVIGPCSKNIKFNHKICYKPNTVSSQESLADYLFKKTNYYHACDCEEKTEKLSDVILAIEKYAIQPRATGNYSIPKTQNNN